MFSGLYVLTDDSLFPHRQWPDRVEACIAGGAGLIQLRDKKLSDDALEKTAYEIREVCQAYQIPLIINDRLALAKKIHADGLHLGRSDISIRAARDYLGPQFILGASCYASLLLGLKAQQAGADYVAFGRIFRSNTKPQAVHCGLSQLTLARERLTVPICAIGGINQKNIALISRRKIDWAACVQHVFNAENPRQAATNTLQQGILHAVS
jgi:thiamine-phosphate pyrophosphorylase